MRRGRAGGASASSAASARCCSASRWAAPSRSRRATSRASSAWSALAPWIPDRLDVSRSRASGWTSSTARWTAGSPASRASARASSRRGFERVRARGVEGTYTLIPGAVHGVALRAPWGAARPAPARRKLGRAASRLELERRSPAEAGAAASCPASGTLHVPDEPEPLEPADHPPREVELEAVRGRASPRPGTRGGCCASPRRRRAARPASCCGDSSRERKSCRPNMWQIEFTLKVACW